MHLSLGVTVFQTVFQKKTLNTKAVQGSEMYGLDFSPFISSVPKLTIVKSEDSQIRGSQSIRHTPNY